MAVTHKPVYAQTVNNGSVQILPADTTSLKTILTAATDGTIVEKLLVTSSDTAAKDLQVYITVGGVDYLIGTMTVPANSGFTASIPSLNFFQHSQVSSSVNQDSNGNKYLRMMTGEVLKAKVLSSVSASKAIYLRAEGGNL